MEQISPLPAIKRYITSHNPISGASVLLPEDPLNWKSSKAKDTAACVAYTTTEFPPKLMDEQDLGKYKETMAGGKLGLVNPSGTVCRVVDFAPGREAIMHSTKSLDYGVVLEGEVEMVLDSNERCTLHRGDIVIQRATMHGWRNSSSVKWARMLFVLQECEDFVVGNHQVVENLEATHGSFLYQNGDSNTSINEI
ncbi:uncharacterized protein PV06_01483 [Exophiala oligosperma]|uniref:Cupin type-2 domain-containing protein n=1 Tax=Exophiala oligosperma TaxID=215243 RepID=A0A0D2CGC9_9EURO|nr:uncharacterized protein PV06_01483 [Exophiala oligosperma]KIW48927.1 hypothetical protein PV06_01483 [Exophiala oligosperma]